LKRGCLRVGDAEIELRRKAFEVLRHLAENAGRLVSKDELFETVWSNVNVSDDSLIQCIREVREKLGDSEHTLIKNVPRRGYLLAAEPSRIYGKEHEGHEALDPVSMDRPSIAVLPFVNMSADPDQEFFSDGITEDITTALCKLKGFFVIARNTMFTYKGRASDIRAIGHDLKVRYVLEGSVRRARHRLRITAQLVEANSGNHIWAESYDCAVEEIFSIQDQITTSIVGRIGPELLAAEYERVSRRLPQNLDAWECVIKALFHSSQQSDEGTQLALSLLGQALKKDPNYAQALGMKAWIMVFRAFQGWGDMGQVLGEAEPLIAHAMASDNCEVWAYLARGMVGFATRDNDLAVGVLTRAVALSPNSVNAHGHLGIAYAFGGRSKEALACIDRATELSPRDTFLSDFELYYAFAHFQGGNYEAGLRFAQQAHRTRPRHPYPILLAAACAGHLGRFDIGEHLVRKLREVLPIVSADFVETTAPYVLSKDRACLVKGLSLVGID
jgi:adenylate cyclase